MSNTTFETARQYLRRNLKRTALAALLAHEHDLLILDEPTNHLDLDAIAFLEEWLASFTGGLLLVTHDRHVLDRVTTKVLELDRGSGYLHTPQGVHAGSLLFVITALVLISVSWGTNEFIYFNF